MQGGSVTDDKLLIGMLRSISPLASTDLRVHVLRAEC